MKTRTKALLLALSAVLLVVSTVFATLAFLTSTSDVVTNTFTVGKVEIKLDEAPVDLYGEVVTGDRRIANEYKLLPGHKYTKDPIVHVIEGSEECWLFVKVVDAIAAIQDADTVEVQMTAKGWIPVNGVENVWAYNAKVDARNAAQNVPVFDYFKITGTADVAAYNSKTITVQAYAIQADGFNTAADAWAAAPATWDK